MTIRDISTARLKEYENNPRNNDLAVEKVKYSIQRFGFLFPVIVDMNYVIVCGHTRVRACRELGLPTVPCIVADELTDEQINLFRLIDNKTSEYSDWDFEKLKAELATVDLTLDQNQLLLERFELSAEVFDIDAEQAEIRIPTFNFMDATDKDRPKVPKPPVSTVHSEEAEEAFEADQAEDDSAFDAPDVMSVGPGAPAAASQPEGGVQGTGEAGEAPTPAPVREPKKSHPLLPIYQFRFGDVAFFISKVELDRLNEKYAEYIDSGEVLSGSFAEYLLKGVESHD